MHFWLTILMINVTPTSSPIDFDTQVMPILTKAGCNAGSCHGAAAGRGGFRLSLYGSRPDADFDEIVRAQEGRRINRRDAASSLLLQKPSEQLQHEGGTRLEFEGANYRLLENWIRQGARRTRQRELIHFAFTAAVRSSDEDQYQSQLQAMATFSDGSQESVLPWTVLSSNDSSAIEVSANGIVNPTRPGRHVITARYIDRVATVEVVRPYQQTSETAPPEQNSSNPGIDEFIDRRLRQLGLTAESSVDDFGFIRRLHLDLTGRLPRAADIAAFVSSTDVDRRSQLIDRLLASDEFVEFWTFRLSQVLRVNSNRQNSAAAKTYYSWIRNCVNNDVPYDRMVRSMVNGQGAITENGPANFYAVSGDARATAEFFSNAFLGVRLQCANCHDHPLDSWTQDDYHGLAAVFARVRKGPIISVGAGDVIHPSTGEPAIAKIPGSNYFDSRGDQRESLATWLTAEENSLFSQAIVNRIWNHLMGRGLVSPIDDLRPTNPSSHPELLRWLAKDFAKSFNFKHTIRRICRSRAYQRISANSRTPQAQKTFYARATPKIMSSAVYLDAVADALKGSDPVDDSSSRNISFLGLLNNRQPKELAAQCATDVCETAVLSTEDISVQLRLLNGDLLNKHLSRQGNYLIAEIAKKTPKEDFIRSAYLRSLSREPSEKELRYWVQQFSAVYDGNSRVELAQDVFWSLLTSEEFYTNH